VHLNFALREPLVPDEPLPDDDSGRADGAPYVRRIVERPTNSEAAGMRSLHELVGSARRGVLVAGRDQRAPGARDTLGDAAASFAATLGWPLLADPMSRARRGPAAVAHYDALLRDERFAAAVRPDLVVRVGDLPVSKPLRSWLGALPDVPQVAIDPEAAWQDPMASLSESLALDAPGALSFAVEHGQAGAGADWLARWRAADQLASAAIAGELAGDALSEPRIAAELGVLLPQDATLFVSSSMPVRDIEAFWGTREDPPRVLCNRGANGIDGVVSSAFGAAGAGVGPVVLLIGDVALAHDIGGLLAARRLALPLTIVLLNNSGGAIFDFLPLAHAAAPSLYETHVSTPPELRFASAAELYGLTHEHVGDVQAFRSALTQAPGRQSATLIEIATEREANVALHQRIWRAVASSLAQL
jgi:2-succinyl-5-enolpyruvyl-6-hydroxy-3-cyclohexene-1-carboxylate synthase